MSTRPRSASSSSRGSTGMSWSGGTTACLKDALPARIHPASHLSACTVQTRRDGGLLGAEQLRRLTVAQADHVDGDQRVAKALGQRGDVGEDLARLDRGIRPHRARGIDGLELLGHGRGLRAAHGGAVAADEGVAQDPQQVAEIVVVAQEARLGRGPWRTSPARGPRRPRAIRTAPTPPDRAGRRDPRARLDRAGGLDYSRSAQHTPRITARARRGAVRSAPRRGRARRGRRRPGRRARRCRARPR